MFMHTLLIRGIRNGRIGMIVAGSVLALVWLTFLWAIGKRLMGRPKEPPPEG
jgi:hypothetical protein